MPSGVAVVFAAFFLVLSIVAISIALLGETRLSVVRWIKPNKITSAHHSDLSYESENGINLPVFFAVVTCISGTDIEESKSLQTSQPGSFNIHTTYSESFQRGNRPFKVSRPVQPATSFHRFRDHSQTSVCYN